MADEEWVEITVLGSQYEEEIEIKSGRHRHRKRWLSTGDDSKIVEPWKPGRAPDNR